MEEGHDKYHTNPPSHFARKHFYIQKQTDTSNSSVDTYKVSTEKNAAPPNCSQLPAARRFLNRLIRVIWSIGRLHLGCFWFPTWEDFGSSIFMFSQTIATSCCCTSSLGKDLTIYQAREGFALWHHYIWKSVPFVSGLCLPRATMSSWTTTHRCIMLLKLAMNYCREALPITKLQFVLS